ncbi:MAG: alpha-amylase family glycosyl hydrolase [Bacteroidota bacterium]
MNKLVRLKLIKWFYFSILIFSSSVTINCSSAVDTSNSENTIKSVAHTEWSRNATIYEVNVRQFTQEGTFNAFADHLPELKAMGIDILWFMPIHPIGVKNRKGTLGSYYSVKDYKAVNPEFGSLDDFKNVVNKAHQLGMYVIIDWVANHTSWDNVWTQTHTEFYNKDNNGNFISPFDWTDVIDLNYENKELWNFMTDALKYWVQECNIDGYRCDVAAMVPLEFWKFAKPQLDAIKPVFMLAEAHEPELHEVFDMTYNWQLKDLFVGIAESKKNGDDLHKYFLDEKITYPADSYRMVFTTNHDENSWNGTDAERFGAFAEAFAVITGLVRGMPLVYSGMEGGLDKRLLFFEKDPIVWKESKYRNLYTKLFSLKHENKALWNGIAGAEMVKVNANDPFIFSFTREKDGNKIFALFNLSRHQKNISLDDQNIAGTFTNLFSGETVSLSSKQNFNLEPYGYLVYYK